ncbi:hypothetical protein U9R90_03845 [Streptomyces sp. E11-3]|uniref:hypothetical protein n=1 Tax=Streptomyces sp. E11-3 TaxID=3110112 RepID=UPI003981301A
MSGPLRLVPEDGGALPSGPYGRHTPSWAVDPVDELAARLAEPVGAAVHPYEVAAILESAGMTGDQITERYGHRDLFALADDVYARVPRHYPEPPPPPDPWRPDHLRCALRGLLFAVPGLGYLLAGSLWGAGAGAGVPALVVAALTSWAWNQGLSHRAHLRLSAGGRAAAVRTLRTGAPVGALAATVAALFTAGPGLAAAFAAGQSCYLGAATALLVLGRERLLLVTLLPVVGGAALLLWRPLPPTPTTVLLLATVLLAVSAAAHTLRAAAPPPAADAPGYAASLPYAVFGLAAGVLVVLAGAHEVRAVVVLTLSMGAAEWLLYRYRGLALAALRASTVPRAFALRAARALALCLAGYLGLLTAGALVAGVSPGPLLALGTLLWTALLLQAFTVAWLPATVCLCTAAVWSATRLADVPPGAAQVACCVAASALLLGCALWLLGRVTAHR